MKDLMARWAMVLVLACSVSTWAGCGGSSGDSGGATTTYTLSGTVSGSTASGVTLTLSGAGSSTTTTGASGTYSFTGLAAGSYTVTPSLTGYTFSPGNTPVTISSADVSGVDFASTSTTLPTYTLSGTISGSAAGGVTVSLSGAGSSTTTTDASGNYSFTVAAGAYTITPILSGYGFSPTSRSVTVTGANVSDVDFTGAIVVVTTYTLSGTVDGDIAEGVTVALSGAGNSTTTTDNSGDYSFTVAAGSYTVTPALNGYVFSPASASVTVAGADAAGIDFTSTASTLGDRTDYSSVTLTSGGIYSAATAGVEKQYYEYTSAASDTPAVKVSSGGSLTLTNSKATKSGATANKENSGFYGFNSGVLASSSSQTSSFSGTGTAATINLTDCTITTSASGANGAFAFGEDAVVNLDHVTIITTGSDNSRGVDATYGGTVNISNSIISTQGGSCAALATDRYDRYESPKINATNCVGTTAGTGSPGIYCTGTFNVTDCALTATGSEAACIEGLNSITLENTSISGTKKWGVMIYQSMSGDSSIGTGTFTMTDGTLTNNFADGPMFFVCNTDAMIELDGAALVNSSDMLLVAGKASTASSYLDNVNSSWGTNGGEVTFTAIDQTLSGDIILCDSASSIDLSLTNSAYSGAINTDNKGTAEVTLDAGSSWAATGTSYLSSLTNNGTITGAGKIYVNGTQVY